MRRGEVKRSSNAIVVVIADLLGVARRLNRQEVLIGYVSIVHPDRFIEGVASALEDCEINCKM